MIHAFSDEYCYVSVFVLSVVVINIMKFLI